MSLVGCSKKENIASDGNAIYCSGKATSITEHKGYEAVRVFVYYTHQKYY